MSETSYELSDVERLSVILDDVIRDWDEPDRQLMHVLFARAGEAYPAESDDEVSGYTISWRMLPAVHGQGGAPPDPCDNLFESFQLGVGRKVNPGAYGMLNPQPLPP
jgi:hypothetical protein